MTFIYIHRANVAESAPLAKVKKNYDHTIPTTLHRQHQYSCLYKRSTLPLTHQQHSFGSRTKEWLIFYPDGDGLLKLDLSNEVDCVIRAKSSLHNLQTVPALSVWHITLHFCPRLLEQNGKGQRRTDKRWWQRMMMIIIIMITASCRAGMSHCNSMLLWKSAT